MGLTIENTQMKAVVDLAIKNAVIVAKTNLMAMDDRQIGMSILEGYASDLINTSETYGLEKKLDLSYESMKNFMPAIGYEFIAGKRSNMTDSENVNNIEKTIAAYLTLLSVKNHGLNVKFKKSSMMDSYVNSNTDCWSGFEVWVQGNNAKDQFLPEIYGNVTYKDGELSVRMDKICRAYMRLTGVALEGVGVDSAEYVYEMINS